MLLQILNAHSYPITALNFSDDGKMLGTYAYGDSTISIWMVSGVCCVCLCDMFTALAVNKVVMAENSPCF